MNKRGRIPAAALALLLGVVLVLACRPSQTVQRQTDDAGMKTKIKAKLAKDVGAATITSVEVNVTNGVVTLAGPVSSGEEKLKIERVARSVDGVVSVTNNLQVTAPPATSPQPATSSSPATTPLTTPRP
ncbi:MAG TPA: BON domain-containing protein [Thermoanaerobaculia bacterium]|jgi:hypothetical protein